MATRRDLVDAQAFTRRRVVAAFVSGAGEVERVHSGRCLVGGLLLSLVLLGGAAVADEVSPYLPEDLGLGQTANEGADPAPSR